jgi:hypothetical protein
VVVAGIFLRKPLTTRIDSVNECLATRIALQVFAPSRSEAGGVGCPTEIGSDAGNVSSEPYGLGAAGLQHFHGGIEGSTHLGVGAVKEEVGGNTDPQPAHVPIERSLVVRDGLGRRRRIGCITKNVGGCGDDC